MTTGNISSMLGGNRPPLALHNRFSGGVTTASTAAGTGGPEITSGALSAGVLSASLITIAGAGAIKFLQAYTKDATSRTIRLKVVIDGVTVFDATSGTIASQNLGMVAVGDYVGSIIIMERIIFNVSLAVYVASSLSETDKIGVSANYETD